MHTAIRPAEHMVCWISVQHVQHHVCLPQPVEPVPVLCMCVCFDMTLTLILFIASCVLAVTAYTLI